MLFFHNVSGHFGKSRYISTCPSRKSHPVLKYLQLERSSAILLHRPAHPNSNGLLHIYGPPLRSLFAHPEPHRIPNSARGRESRAASATGRPQPENSSAATASARSILLGDSLATLEGEWDKTGSGYSLNLKPIFRSQDGLSPHL